MRWIGLPWVGAGVMVPGGGKGKEDCDARRSLAFSTLSTLSITMEKRSSSFLNSVSFGGGFAVFERVLVLVLFTCVRTAGLDTGIPFEETEVATDGDCAMSGVCSSSSSSSRGFRSGVPPIFPVKISSTVRARSLPVSSVLLCVIGRCIGRSFEGLLGFGSFPLPSEHVSPVLLLPALPGLLAAAEGEDEEYCLVRTGREQELSPLDVSTPGSILTITGLKLPPLPCLFPRCCCCCCCCCPEEQDE